MLTYDIESRGRKPIYEYLYECIKRDITEQRISAGERLPSKRELAKHLKISTITVENAYAQLIAEGYIYAVEKRGYFAGEFSGQIKAPRPPERSNDAAAAREQYLVDFTSNKPDADRFPFSVWSRLMRRVLADEDTRLLGEIPHSGVYELRSAVAEYLYSFRGMSVSPDNIIIGAGTEYLYGLLIQLLGRDKLWGVENPGYSKISKVYTAGGARVAYVELDRDGVSSQALEASRADIIHLSPSHHFPTGTVTPIKRRYELLEWANRREDRYIIEDDYDSEFRFSGRPIQTMQSIDTHGRVIYMNTFSKSIAPSIRISYMVLPDALMREYRERLGFYSCAVSGFEQHTLARFISEGYFEKHISRMKNFYKAQRNKIIELIESSGFSEIVKVTEENAGLHFLLTVKTALSDSELKSLLMKCGIRALCLSDYFAGDDISSSGTVVVNYSGINIRKLGEALTRLGREINVI